MNEGSHERSITRGLLLSALVAALAATCLLAGGAGCKKKPPKLTKEECETFCERLVPCFAQAMGEHAMDVKADTAECIRDCRGKEGQKHGQLLRAMKDCGHLTDCHELRKCFGKSL